MAMTKITTPKFRVSFPAVFKPHAFEGQDPKFGVTMLFSKDTDISALKQLAASTVKAKWPEGKPTGPFRSPFRDGDVEKPDTDGYAGHWFIKATSKMQPQIVDHELNPIFNEGDFYPGCYARATITCYAYDRVGNRGVAFGLQNLQKLGEGKSFSGRRSAENDFEAVAGEAATDTSTTDDELFG